MPTLRQKTAVIKISEILRGSGSEAEKLKSIGAILRASGYAKSTSERPSLVTRSQGFRELMEKEFPDAEVASIHKSLLGAKRLDHMVFSTTIDDKEIKELITSAGCVLRKIAHSDQAKHVYFWAPDNTARDHALDKLYKLKGRYAPVRVYTEPDPLEEMDDEELDRNLREAEALLEKRRGGNKKKPKDNAGTTDKVPGSEQ